MLIRIGTITGERYVSDSTPMDKIKAEFMIEWEAGAEKRLRRGFGPGDPEDEFRRRMEDVVGALSSPGRADNISITIKGQQRNFNANHILWTEVDMEGESL